MLKIWVSGDCDTVYYIFYLFDMYMLCDLFFNSSLICNVYSFVEITEIERPTNMRFICSSKHASRVSNPSEKS